MNQKKTIAEILELDSKFRGDNVSGDLHTLKSLRTDNSWDFSCPTLCRLDESGYKQTKYSKMLIFQICR